MDGNQPIDNTLGYNDPNLGIPMDYQTPWNFNYRDESRHASLINELSPQEYVRHMIKEFKGEIWNEKTGEYEKVEGIKPLLNDEGITLMYTLLTSAINEVTTYSNYRDDLRLIYRIMRKIYKDAVPRLHYFPKEYGIESDEQISIILDKLYVMLSAYFKALGAGDRKAATSNISETISSINRIGADNQNPQDNKTKGGIFSIFGGRK